jgi:hypothetical protein
MRSTTHPLPDELVRDIAARAAGNPFFLEELTRTLETTGTASDIPDTVQGVLAARIDRLGATDKRLLQIAAVIGARVPLALWRAVGECSEEDIRQALERLQQGGFLHETRSTTGSACVFKHALTREVAYRSLLHSTRQGLHERTARLIAKHFADSVFGQPEVLAYHYTEAGVHREAVACWRQAGRRAYERSAMPEAMMHHVPQGLDVLHERRAADRPTTIAPAWSSRLLPTQGPALMAARGHTDPQVRETWAKTRELCERPSDGRRCSRAWSDSGTITGSRGSPGRRSARRVNFWRWRKSIGSRYACCGRMPRWAGSCSTPADCARPASIWSRGSRTTMLWRTIPTLLTRRA